ncbi:phosphotransferase [Microbacterium amylolyticum]|uniref:Aminoglycoside phosphotransferase (APT) family kinase protein n=1 Tax=Microbacterium amylolyticum TaxID=936337 RepID=A0ABS4ZL79_9MICO|nr:phosphotransferase [Microbacterium amylolyticum]MBP2437778.1 aminoglycoside phosphotransferase (APT) family kinase protein [Microbacterium amylolyticum]
MARSPFTLAAAATAAFSGAEIVGARRLTAEGAGRYDAAIATLSDGRDLVVRIPTDDDALADAESELIALRALTHGVRDLLPFDAPEFLGSAPVLDSRVIVTDYLPGYQVEAAHVPRGRGIAHELGRGIARIHALPPSIVRSAGLPERSPSDARADLEKLLDVIGRSGRVPVRLMVRWREAAEDERLWSYESTVVLGGVQTTSFLFDDDDTGEPRLTGLLDWHGLAIGDPAIDMHWTASAPDAADDVFTAYAAASVRAPDGAMRVRARLHAELEFAKWLVHGVEAHRADIVDDAADLLESLSAGLADDQLLSDLPDRERADVSEVIALLDRVPRAHGSDDTPRRADTSMHTDAFSPEELRLHADEDWDAAPPRRDTAEESTQPLSPPAE